MSTHPEYLAGRIDALEHEVKRLNGCSMICAGIGGFGLLLIGLLATFVL